MAYYHKDLKYHEDKIEKRKITPEEIEFLISLQKEMNTQDTCGNAAPRFWVIKGKEKIFESQDEYGENCGTYIGKIYSDTLFLTQKSAENHLKSNHYNYDKDAHTYAMTAWRSPEVQMLWKIIQEINWEELK